MLIYVPTSLGLEGEPVAIQSKILHRPMRNRHGHFTPFTGHWSVTDGLVSKKIKAWSETTGVCPLSPPPPPPPHELRA